MHSFRPISPGRQQIVALGLSARGLLYIKQIKPKKDVMQPTDVPLQIPPEDLLRGASLFLDLDGTLVEFALHPESVVIDARLSALLWKLAERLDGRMAMISGRSVDQVIALLGHPPFAIAGSHGLEMRWPNGRSLAVPRPERLSEVEAEMTQLATRHAGLLVERKPFSAALHYRMAPDLEDQCRQLANDLELRTGLQLQAGNMVYELKAPWADKGTALTFLMAGSDMSGARPVFIGDDFTDEAGFVAAASLGGAGVLVGAPRSSAATYRLDSVAATLAWLEAAVEALP